MNEILTGKAYDESMFVEYSEGEDFTIEMKKLSEEDKARKWNLMRIYLGNKLEVDFPEWV